jgi:predicted flap endonuclease-1-like 5' DNA nuclease
MNWCILIPLLVGLICAILGYLLGKLLGGKDDECNDKIVKLEADLEACKKSKHNLEADLEACMKARHTLEADLKACRNSKLSLEGDLNATKASLASSLTATAAPLIAFDAAAAKAVFGKTIKQDDLKIVEGIGPKIQELFHNHDVKTWKALSECSVEKCQSVLDSGGERFKIHKPGTWPKQAQLAYEGKWAELLKWQDELDGGK